MNWLNFFDTKTTHRKHPFGRGTNASLSPNEEELFNKSYEAFEKKDIVNAYDYFLKSLENYCDENPNQNIITKMEGDKLHFEIFQGSAKVTGTITKEHFYAEVIIIKKKNATVALKRYILERNYQLTYAYYFSDDEYIKLKLFHDNITMSPQKIFFPIRELALNADFDKEHIKSEFPNIELEGIGHLNPIDKDELKTKYDFLHKWIDELDAKILTLPSNDNAGMQAFLHLNILFKIDYLLVPKYDIYHKISKKVQEYFGDENPSIEAKNEELKRYICKLKNMSFDDFRGKFYNAKYTFNPTEKTSFEEITNFISESLTKIRWYKNNRYNQIIPTIYRYIAFYTLYNYGLNQVMRELLHTLIEIQNQTFFNELKYPVLYSQEDETFSKKTIISRIEDIIEPHQARFKELEPFGSELNFSNMNEFSNSFYLQINSLNFEEI
ncbi:MAG: hypothetical protein U9P72_04975 [Campylobacterota bacterium]|nr:hypothetical protein [Campylobacterota bacterium]